MKILAEFSRVKIIPRYFIRDRVFDGIINSQVTSQVTRVEWGRVGNMIAFRRTWQLASIIRRFHISADEPRNTVILGVGDVDLP